MIAPKILQKEVAKIFGVMDVNGRGSYGEIRKVLRGVEAELGSERWGRYKQSFGIMAEKMPGDYPGVSPVNVFRNNFKDTLYRIGDMRFLVMTSRTQTKDFYLTAACLFGCLANMTLHHEDIDDAHAGRYEH